MRWKQTLTVVGVHAEGEYGKVVTGGVVDVPGRTMFEKMRWLARRRDGLRKFLLFEPRGAAVHSANVVLPATRPGAALGFVIMESTEYPPMSGSNTICTVTAILETGIVPMTEPITRLRLETPAGLIDVTCRCRAGRVLQVKFRNVPAFVQCLDAPVEVEGLGTVTIDVAYGGMHYALVDAARLGFRITPDEARDICAVGERIREAARRQLRIVHPQNPEIRDVTITEFMGPLRRRGRGLAARNTVVVSPGRLDRSPCGTGTSARLAVMHARRQIRAGQSFDHESVIGTHFLAEIVGTTRVGRRPAVLTTVAGRGWITSIGQYGYDPDDPFPEGYTLSDTWLRAI
ncbi:MAG TPA: proline racemase family protein [Methylomirabilota bacterium]|jgi:proline racemase|nr:proline racemase family protein [Methylomirabilota bacterium]